MLETWSDVLDQPRGIFLSDNGFRSYLAENRGFLEQPRNQPFNSEGFASIKKDFIVKYEPDNSNNLRRIFDISDRYNFKILIVFNPIFANYETEITVESYSRVKEKVNEAASSYSNVYVEDEPVRFFPDHFCGSITHLYIEGATKNTKELIPVMQDIINNPKH